MAHPLAELDGARRGDAVADGEDHVEVVDLDLTSDPPGALRANHQLRVDGCLIELVIGQDTRDDLLNVLHRRAVEPGHLRLGEPHRAARGPQSDTAAVIGLIEDDLAAVHRSPFYPSK